MQICLVDEELKSVNLAPPKLAVLQPTEQLFTALLVQPSARVEVSDDYIRNSNRKEAADFHLGVIDLAKSNKVELLITPEYSFPWQCLDKALADGMGPDEGQLWILGCESLGLSEVDTLKARFQQFATVLHEDIPVGQAATARYVDPLVYLFRTRDQDGAQHLVMLIQFKTAASGDAENTEATRLALGNKVYKFAFGHEVRLISLICSDAFAFVDHLVDEHYENLLLVHIQLNEKPRNEDYMRYRRRLYSFECDRTEVICLNWAKDIAFQLPQGKFVQKTNISGSAWHSRSTKFATDDARIESNHLRGLYYTHDAQQKRHMLHFTYEQAAFLVHSTKVRHHAIEAAKSRRRGPEVQGVWSWIGAKWTKSAVPLDDGFLKMTAAYGAPPTALDSVYGVSRLAVERIACITSGRFGPSQRWFHPDLLPTAQLAERTEVVQRVTVAQDPDGQQFRDMLVRTVKALESIPADELPLPHNLQEFRGGYRFDWHPATPHFNVVTQAGNRAAFLYVGENPSRESLASSHSRARATLSGTAGADRFCLFFRQGAKVDRFDPPVDREITASSSAPGKDFTEPNL